MESLPNELTTLIHDYVDRLDTGSNITQQSVKQGFFVTSQLSLVNQKFGHICHKRFVQLNNIHQLINKYTVYQKEYEHPNLWWHTGANLSKPSRCRLPSPIIYDMVLTGCCLPYANSTFREVSDIIDDLHTAIQLLPESINYDDGYLRCRNKVTPLYAACINENMPLEIVQLLIKHGANKNHYILLNNQPISILSDLVANITDSRLRQIQKIFSSLPQKSPTPTITSSQ